MSSTSLRAYLAAVAAACCLLAACGGDSESTTDEAPDAPLSADSTAAAGPSSTPAADVVALLRADGRFTRFVALIDSSGMAGSLQGPGPFTLFAPTDAAFAALPPDTVAALFDPAARDRLMDRLLLHVVQGAYASATLPDTTLVAQQAGTLRVAHDAGRTTVNGATVTEADLPAGNGVVHVIDAVLR